MTLEEKRALVLQSQEALKKEALIVPAIPESTMQAVQARRITAEAYVTAINTCETPTNAATSEADFVKAIECEVSAEGPRGGEPDYHEDQPTDQ